MSLKILNNNFLPSLKIGSRSSGSKPLKSLNLKHSLFHLWAIRDVDWNNKGKNTMPEINYFISEQSEMWIETDARRNQTDKGNFISEQSEMWIETPYVPVVSTPSGGFHLWAIRDVDWNCNTSSECIINVISSLSNQRCGLKQFFIDVSLLGRKFHLWAIRDVDWNLFFGYKTLP